MELLYTLQSSLLISLMDGSIFDWALNKLLVYSMYENCLSLYSLNKFTNLIKECGTVAFRILL